MIAITATTVSKPQENAVSRLKRRVSERLDAEKDRPRAYRKSQRGLAEKLGITEPTLSEMLNGKTAERGALARLDDIAAYFGVPPSLLVHRNDTALMELHQEEYRLLTHWRTLPPDVQQTVMDLFDYFAGLLPEEKEQRRWWTKIMRLTPNERQNFERTLDEQIRGRRSQRAPNTAPAAPGPTAETRAASDRKG